MPLMINGEITEEPEPISIIEPEPEPEPIGESIYITPEFIAEREIAIAGSVIIGDTAVTTELPKGTPDSYRTHYMSDYIKVDWAKNFASPYPIDTYYMIFTDLSDAPDLIKQKGMYDIMIHHVRYISPYMTIIVGGRLKDIEQAKIYLDNMGVTVLDDTIFDYNQLQKTSMFAHETKGLSIFTGTPDTAIREDEEANKWITEKSEERGRKFKWGFWVIIIVIIVVLILLGIGYMYIKSFIQAKFMKKAKGFM